MREAPHRQAKGHLSLSTAAGGSAKRASGRRNVVESPYRAGDAVCWGVSARLQPEDGSGSIGPNGSGKSSLSRSLIAGRRQAEGGKPRTLVSTVQLAYFDQQAEALVAGGGWTRKVIEYVQEAASRSISAGSRSSASQRAERFFVPPASQHSPISSSRGRAANGLSLPAAGSSPQVLLASMSPTNDLDVQNVTVGSKIFLEDFRGLPWCVSPTVNFPRSQPSTAVLVRWTACSSAFEGKLQAPFSPKAGPRPQRRRPPKTGRREPPRQPAAPPASPVKATGNSLAQAMDRRLVRKNERRRKFQRKPRTQRAGRASCPARKRSASQWSNSYWRPLSATNGQLDSLTRSSRLAERIHRAGNAVELSDLAA